jgi:HD-GYP domain-containing protein (c-di-GMP phosphodiesterase class II)
MARVIEAADEDQVQLDAIVAALLHDVGMAEIPLDVLNQEGRLSCEARQAIESHVATGRAAVGKLSPCPPSIVDAIRGHHERMDGSGYGAGLCGSEVTWIARLLAVCDTYAALGSPRAYRAAASPRAALTETLREAERGRLDHMIARRLLGISFYPVGSGVELSDGQVGVVVATHPVEGDLSVAGRPVIQVLVDSEGGPVPEPTHIDLAREPTRHLARVLSVDETRERLGA